MAEHSTEKLRQFAIRRIHNIISVEAFVAANIALVLLFILFYAARRIWRATGAGKKHIFGISALVSVSQ